MNKETLKAIDLIANKFLTSTSIAATVNDLSQSELLDAAIGAVRVANGLAKYASKAIPGVNIASLSKNSVKIRASDAQYAQRPQ